LLPLTTWILSLSKFETVGNARSDIDPTGETPRCL
jgi:hypothetical protein